MPTSTTNYNLTLYDRIADTGQNFIDFRDNLAGTGSNSNMVKIDAQMKANADAITNLAGTGRTTETVKANADNIKTLQGQSFYYVNATASSANTYTATVSGITTYSADLRIILTVSAENTGAATININGLGAKTLTKIDSSGNPNNLSAGDLQVGKQYVFRYNGSLFIAINLGVADQIHILDSGNYFNAINVEDALQEISVNIGNKSNLSTTDKTSLVNAINENVNKIGVLSNLQTNIKTDLVSATNEITDKLSSGVLNTLQLTLGYNNIKHTGETPIFPRISLTGMDYVNLLGNDGNCEDISKWSTVNAALTLDSSNYVFGSNGIKVTVNSGQTIGQMYKNMIASMDSSKYYCLSAYIKNGNCSSGVAILLYTNGTGKTLKQSTIIADATKFTRILVRLQPSDWGTGSTYVNVEFRGIGAGLQYGYVDGISLFEVSASDYALDDATLLAKYPYVDSYATLQNPYFEVRRDNLVRNGNGEEGIGYWELVSGVTSFTALSTGGFQVVSSGIGKIRQKVPVKKNTDYYLKSTKNGDGYVIVLDGSFTSQIGVAGDNFTFNSGNNEAVYVEIYNNSATTVIYNNIMLIEGTTAPTEYKPCRIERYVVEGQFTKDDSLTIEDGKVTGQLWWKHRTLYGKDYTVVFGTDYTGFKTIKVQGLLTMQIIAGNSKLIGFDGSLLIEVTSFTAANQYKINSATEIEISVADSVSGFSESINPNNDESAAEKNGWKAIANNGTRYIAWVSVIDGSIPSGSSNTTVSTTYTSGSTSLVVADGTKFAVNDTIALKLDSGSWATATVSAINGNTLTLSAGVSGTAAVGNIVMRCDNGSSNVSLLTWCKNNIAPNYEGYRLHYKLANPEPITDANVHVHGDIWALEKGDNYVMVDSGIVLGEVANPFLTSGNYYINGMNTSASTKFTEENLFSVYKNQNYDALWTITTRSTPSTIQGKTYASIPQANFDPNAIYTVDYQILKTLHAQSFTSLTMDYAQGVFEAIKQLTETVENKQKADSALDRYIDLSMYEKVHVDRSIRFCNFASNQALVTINIPIRVKKAMPIITVNSIQIKSKNGDGTYKDVSALDIRYYPMYLSVSILEFTVVYYGTDSTIRNNLLNNGGRIIIDLTLDCRGRI